jgi:glycosyl hydrolase family 26
MSPIRLVATVFALTCVAVVGVTIGVRDQRAGHEATRKALAALGPAAGVPPGSPSQPEQSSGFAGSGRPLIGAYALGVPGSTAPLTRFESSTGTRLGLALYFSSWREPFQTAFATSVSRMGAIPLVQIEPANVSLQSIADGSEDDYLVSYANAIRLYGGQVILSFGHEMNGNWYHWGSGRTSPSTFIAAWRHFVDVFRVQGASNVTWLWTVNVTTGMTDRVTNPALWWPGGSYVTWVGIDGYYWLDQTETFGKLFDVTIADVRQVTSKPILIAETGVAPELDRATMIPDLFAGVKHDGLLGIVWFDSTGNRDWRIDNDPAAAAAFRSAAKKYGFAGT